MSGKKCKNCGSSDIEVDPARGDAVCTNCGTVLEDNIIVAEIEFQENAHGGASAIGQFVSADTKGGATGFGGAFNAGIGQESRELTIRKARHGITALCQQLRLNQQCIDIACNFFKMALSRHLTKGRPASHIHAACVYITCRTEGTTHLLIDISDALQICCYQLGRTYLRLSRSLCINIPSIDPCLYILRFAAQLQFGEREHEVSMTALRLVQRMKRDSIHSGRRPSGLCGAALLIAARLHEFCRSPTDVVRIVKVHESTLRKRLLEFGDTPSSALTLDEFMTVDLEEEQDPPAFRAARKRDKERLQKLLEEEGGETELTELQREIDVQLEKDNVRKKRVATPGKAVDASVEEADAERFAVQDTLQLLGEIAKEMSPLKREAVEKGLAPDLAVMGIGQPEEPKTEKMVKRELKHQFGRGLQHEELVMSMQDEAYIDTLIMSEEEATRKTKLWNQVNAGFLREQKIKEETRARDREEGRERKKKVRGNYKKKTAGGAATAGEAIEKMLQEKRISTKINYDILRSLDAVPEPASPAGASPARRKMSESNPESPIVLSSPVAKRSRKKNPPPTLLLAPPSPAPAPFTPAPPSPAPSTPAAATPAAEAAEEDDEELETEVADGAGEMQSLASMLHTSQDDDYYDYEEY